MTIERLLIIRHAEAHDETGVTEAGQIDARSINVRGWQRAGALVRFFHPAGRGSMTPDAIFASRIGPGSESRRPQQTIAPLLADMRSKGAVFYSDIHSKPDTAALMADVMTRSGTVLVAWEHSQIPNCVAGLPDAPATPDKWPTQRYDLVWVFERIKQGWNFTQLPQSLLPGDGPVHQYDPAA